MKNNYKANSNMQRKLFSIGSRNLLIKKYLELYYKLSFIPSINFNYATFFKKNPNFIITSIRSNNRTNEQLKPR